MVSHLQCEASCYTKPHFYSDFFATCLLKQFHIFQWRRQCPWRISLVNHHPPAAPQSPAGYTHQVRKCMQSIKTDTFTKIWHLIFGNGTSDAIVVWGQWLLCGWIIWCLSYWVMSHFFMWMHSWLRIPHPVIYMHWNACRSSSKVGMCQQLLEKLPSTKFNEKSIQ